MNPFLRRKNELQAALQQLAQQEQTTRHSLHLSESNFPESKFNSQQQIQELLQDIAARQRQLRTQLSLLEEQRREQLRVQQVHHRIHVSAAGVSLITVLILLFSVGVYLTTDSTLGKNNTGSSSAITASSVGILTIAAQKTDFAATEQPVFELRSSSGNQGNLLTGNAVFSSTIAAFLQEPGGNILPLTAALNFSRGWATISLRPERQFRPGKYSLLVQTESGNILAQQNFTWGVLALNLNQSSYRSGEQAFIGMAVLDDQGRMVCDAQVILNITDPAGASHLLSTENGQIHLSEECAVYGVTTLPDYYTYYEWEEEGPYSLTLTAQTSNGLRSIYDSVSVYTTASLGEPFVVSRSGPTRIYPSSYYAMNLSITSTEYFKGTITEYLPSSFATITPNASVSFEEEGKKIEWNVVLLPHQTYHVSYLFDAPDESPQFYLLGPLQIGKWQEPRSWQIAADALTGVTMTAPSANQSIFTSNTFTMTCQPTCDGIGDPAGVNVRYLYSTSSACGSPTDITTATNAADVLSVDAQNDSTTCGTGASGTITARNPGTAYVVCRAEAPTGFNGGCAAVTVAQGCGTLTATTSLTGNLSTTGTCMTIGASHITLNCSNYQIVYGTGGSANTYGVVNTGGYDNVTIKNCNIDEGTTTGASKFGIYIDSASMRNTLANSSISTIGQSSHGILIQGGSNTSNITDIIITTAGTNAFGLLLPQSSHDTITAVSITVSGSAASGIGMATSHNNTFIAPNISANTGMGIRMTGSDDANNRFINATIRSAQNLTIYDISGTNTNNTLLYNATFGMINWTRGNISTNMTILEFGSTIFIANRTIGVADEAQMQNLNSSARITFWWLQYNADPFLLRAGERCSQTIFCNMTYDRTSGELVVNVSSFSNYTVNGAPVHLNVPILNSTDPTTNNTNQNLTLYVQNVSDPDQDSIKNITNWLRNGTSIMVLNMPLERYNGTSTLNARDYSGYANNASEQNGAFWNSSGGYDQRGAYRFDGSNDYLEIPSGERANHAVLNFTGNFTIMARIFRIADSTTYEHLLAKSSDTAFDYFLAIGNDDSIHAGFTDADGVTQNLSGNGGTLAAGQWHHLAVSFNGTNLNGYVNGFLNETSTVAAPVRASAVPLRIGRFLTGHNFNGAIDEIQIYNRSLSAVQILALYQNRSTVIVSQEITSGQNWSADVTPNDGFFDGAMLRSNQVIVAAVAAGGNNLPTPPLTGRPFNGSAITNRTPIFDWFNSSDADGNVISYHLQVDDNARFNNPEINVSAIQDLSSAAPENTTWYSTLELAVDTTYYWRVRSNDSTGYGTWSNGASSDGPGDASNLSNFTVNSLLSITMMTNAAEFGEVAPGIEVNTSDQVPAPFRAENTGNIDANVSLNASAIFSTVPINRSAYQFKIRANQSNAFSSALSAMGWTNMTNSTTAAHVVNLTWRSGKNDFLTDINLTIPSDEPSGFKTSTITFTLTRNE